MMVYDKRLPNNKDIIWLSKLVTSYPATRRDIVRMARLWNFKQDVVSFLRLFSPDHIFTSRTDLVTKCEDLEILIRQEWESPKEVLRSPEG